MKKELCLSILYLHSVVTGSNKLKIESDEGSNIVSSFGGSGKKQFLDTSYLDLLNAAEVEIQLEEGRVSLFNTVPGMPQMKGFFYGQNEQQSANIYKDPESGIVFGSIVDSEKNEISQITTNSIGETEVITKSVDDFTDEDESLKVPESKVAFFGARNLRQSPRSLNDVNVIDVMVLWTRKAECSTSGLYVNCALTDQTRKNMFAKIHLAVDETNIAFALSGINAQLRLVHAYLEDSYKETTSSDALQDLTFQYDGNMDDVHDKRKKFGADVVSFLIHSATGCGLGWVGPHKDYMFSVVNEACATGYFSFGHELAHNIGCNHDRGSENDCASMAPNFGYRDPNGQFRDIMSYNCQSRQCDNVASGTCTRVQRFSNTASNYDGAPIGNQQCDCASHINARVSTVAGYQDYKTDEQLVELGQFEFEGDPPTPSPTRKNCKPRNKTCGSNSSCCSGECTWRRCQ